MTKFINLGENEMRKIVLIMMFCLFIFSGCSVKDLATKSNYTKDFNSRQTKELYKDNKYEEAEKIVLEHLEKHPNDILALGEQAYILIAKGKNEEGIILLNKLLLEEPNNESLLNNISWAYNNLGLYKIALEYAEKSLKFKQSDDLNYINKGNALFGLKKYDDAIECYNLALDKNKESKYAYYGKGLSLSIKKEYDEALINFKKSFEIDPTDEDYYNKLISTCLQLKKYNDVILFSDMRISLNSEDSNAYYSKASAYAYLNQYESAINYYDEAIKYSKYDADALYEKCLIYLKLNKKDGAYESLKKALADDEEFIDYIDIEELQDLKGYKEFDTLVAR
jgi:tetratricopeptide (TPR) repeat protein